MRTTTSGRKISLKGELGGIVVDSLAESEIFPDEMMDRFLKSNAFLSMKDSLLDTIKEHLEGVTE